MANKLFVVWSRLARQCAQWFPEPVHEGSASIWHQADVLAWLQAKGGYALADGVLDVARSAMQVNVEKELGRLSNQAPKEPEASTA